MRPFTIGSVIALSLAVLLTAGGVNIGGLVLFLAAPVIAVAGLFVVVGYDDGSKKALSFAGTLISLGMLIEVLGRLVAVLLRDPDTAQYLFMALCVASMLVGAILGVHLAAQVAKALPDPVRQVRRPIAERRAVMNPKPLPGRVGEHPRQNQPGDELDLLGGERDSHPR